MNRYSVLLITCIVGINMLTACKETNNASTVSPGANKVSQNTQGQAEVESYSGAVVETMNAGGYTYVQLDLEGEKIWAAGPAAMIRVGEILSINKHMPMNDFHSKALNRDFDVVYFVASLKMDQAGSNHNPQQNISKKQAITANIAKAHNGKTIEEIYSQMQELSGQTLRVRGQVVKYTRDVMGKNWIHIRDNSSLNDLTITTNDEAKMADVVLVEGLLSLNKDYGYGYVYEMIMEEAKVTVE